MYRYTNYYSFLLINILLLLLNGSPSVICIIEFEDYSDSKSDDNSQVEVRAVFINCEPDDREGVSTGSEATRFEREELVKHNTLRDCVKKLALTVKITGAPDQHAGDEYIPIEHVIEGSNKRVRLFDPYVLRLRRESPLQAYKLNRLDTVSCILTDPDELTRENNVQRSRVKRDLAHEHGAWSQSLDSSGVVFTLDHDEPDRYSGYSLQLDEQEEAPIPVDETKTYEESKDCDLRLYPDVAEKSESYQTPRTVTSHRTTGGGWDPRKITVYARQKKISINELNRGTKRDMCLNNNNITISKRYKRHIHNVVVEDTNDEYKRPSITKDQNLNRDRHHFEAKSHVPRIKYDKESLHNMNKKDSEIRSHVRSKINKQYGDNDRRRSDRVVHLSVKDETVKSHPKVAALKKDTSKVKFLDHSETRSTYGVNKYTDNKVVPKYIDQYHTNKIDNTEKEYVLYEIGNPELWYSVHVQLFEKMCTDEGKTVWNDLTKGESAIVSSTIPEWSGQDISVKYRPSRWIAREDFVLPVTSLCLLVPLNKDKFDAIDDFNTTDIENNADYIVVPIDDVVGIEDKNDLKKRERNDTTISSNNGQRPRRVAVRISRAILSGNEKKLKVVTQGTEQYLTLPHRLPHHSQIDLEVRADGNQLVRIGATIRDCGPELAGLTNVNGDEGIVAGPVLLPPRHTRRLRLELPVEVSDKAHCSVALLTEDNEAIAVRDVSIRNGDRCFCVWHCDCVCLGEDPKLLCREMTESLQAAAGLSARERTRRSRSICYHNVVSIDLVVIVLGVLITLFILGVVKAFLGLVFRCIGSWGIYRLLQAPRKLESYYESSLRSRCVVFDDEGWPVHPDTKERSVRLVSRSMEFILNVVFFVTMPFIILCDALKQAASYFRGTALQKGESNARKCETKCYSAYDMQGMERRRKRTLRDWMTPQAAELSTNIWRRQSDQSIPKKDIMRPLLNRKCCCANTDEVPTSGIDSEQDDTEYVLMQMQKSKESLARSQNKNNDSKPDTARNQLKTAASSFNNHR